MSAVPLLRETDPGRVRLARDVLMAVEDHLRAERRVPGHLDRQVPPLRVHDVERVVVDELGPLLQVRDDPAGGPLHLPHRGPRPRDQDQEDSRADSVLRQVLLRDLVLALPGGAEDNRDAVRLSPRLDPRANRPASRIRCVSSRSSSESPCQRRHHTRNPPGLWPSG